MTYRQNADALIAALATAKSITQEEAAKRLVAAILARPGREHRPSLVNAAADDVRSGAGL